MNFWLIKNIFGGVVKKIIPTSLILQTRQLDCLQQPWPKIQDPFVLWVALQTKGSIPIFILLQQHDPKDNPFCKWVFMRENTQIWVMPLLALKMGLPYRHSVGGYMYFVGDPFWVWVPQWVSCWRQPYMAGLWVGFSILVLEFFSATPKINQNSAKILPTFLKN